MAAVVIKIDGVAGSNDDFEIDTVAQLLAEVSGFVGTPTYAWTISYQPPGTADVLSSETIANPTLRPQKEGTYLITVLVNASLPQASQATASVIIGVRDLKTGQRIPAAGESTETTLAEGWATDQNQQEQYLLDSSTQGVVITAHNSTGGDAAAGMVVKMTRSALLKSGLPGEEIVPAFEQLLGTEVAGPMFMKGILSGAVGAPGATTLDEGLGRVVLVGPYLVTVAALAAATPGDPVYVQDDGSMGLSPGSETWIAGYAVELPDGTFGVFVIPA